MADKEGGYQVKLSRHLDVVTYKLAQVVKLPSPPCGTY
jgi:hypothetical protein